MEKQKNTKQNQTQEELQAKQDRAPRQKNRKVSPYLVIIILGILDILVLIAMFIFLSSMPQKANEVKELRSLQQSKTFDTERIISDIESVDTKYGELKSYLPDDEGIVTFINELDRLKTDGYISDYAITGGGVIRDKLGYQTLPVVLDFTGSWDRIEEGLNRFQNLPYLTRTSKVETVKGENENEWVLRLGIVLYVSNEVN